MATSGGKWSTDSPRHAVALQSLRCSSGQDTVGSKAVARIISLLVEKQEGNSNYKDCEIGCFWVSLMR